ncbi:uncharacterized protein LOC115014921 [Cottoperca gobio]|uniref:Uncharacterized protein LOC115014921 n=1 Tax=Cottoperca gobio TaxID=56716 RepID=A0A6J2QJV8_COTGO|nr:uncharacterized protein LOC115014921 [Cottoperca gobio]
MHEGTAALQQQQSQTLVDLAAYQKADRDLLQGMLRSSAAPEGESGGGPTQLPRVAVQKMTAEDDPEAFLDIFVGTAEACRWLQAEWGIRLLPLLSGKPSGPPIPCPRTPDTTTTSSGGRSWTGWAAHQRDFAAGSGACPLRTLADPSPSPSSSSTRLGAGSSRESTPLRTSSGRWPWSNSSPDSHSPRRTGSSVTVRPALKPPSDSRRTTSPCPGGAWGPKPGPSLLHSFGPFQPRGGSGLPWGPLALALHHPPWVLPTTLGQLDPSRSLTPQPHPVGLSSHGGVAVGPDCGTARLLPRSGRDIPCTDRRLEQRGGSRSVPGGGGGRPARTVH